MGKLKAVTYDDYAALDDGKRYELIHGELIEMAPAPNDPHQRIEVNVVYYLTDHVKRSKAGQIRCAPYDVMLDQLNTVQPDALYISPQREHLLSERGCEGAPDLVIETLSPSTESRDRNEKASLYFQHGVLEYWLIDPSAECIEVMSREVDGFEIAGRYSGSEVIRSSVLAELELRAEQVFE